MEFEKQMYSKLAIPFKSVVTLMGRMDLFNMDFSFILSIDFSYILFMALVYDSISKCYNAD
jgi:hypothetical protein